MGMRQSSFCLAVISGLVMIQLGRFPSMHVFIGMAGASFGFFGLGVYGVGMELAAECTFPVTETTSTGNAYI